MGCQRHDTSCGSWDAGSATPAVGAQNLQGVRLRCHAALGSLGGLQGSGIWDSCIEGKPLKSLATSFAVLICLIFPTSLCGVLVFDSVSRLLHLRLRLLRRLLCTQHLSHNNFVTQHLSHNNFVTHPLSHNNFVTHPLSHNNFVTHHLSHTTLSHNNFVTHHLSHTTLSHIIFHTQLCHPPSFTHHLCHPPSFTHILVNHHLSHTIFQTPSFTLGDIQRRGTWRQPPSLHLAGVALGALGDIHLRFTWQAQHLVNSTR